MKYIIDKSKWVFGGLRFNLILGHSYLKNDKGNMCCLGQICKADGVPEKELQNFTRPHAVRHKLPETHWLLCSHSADRDSRVAVDMMSTNDNSMISLEDREAYLISAAKAVGHELEFIGDYPTEVIEKENSIRIMNV